MRITRVSLSLRVFFALAACGSLASASPILFSGTQGNLAASALFDNTTTNFTLTLNNIGSQTANDSEVLIGVFFKLSDGATLTPVSASLGPGSTLVQAGATDLAENVGANWQYKSGLSPALVSYGGGNQGVSGAGLHPLFGPDGNFCCGTPQNLDGMPWGLVYPTYEAGDGNGGMKGPYVRNSIVFTFQPVSADVTVSNVFFQYGTTLGGFPADAPEPSAIVLTGIGCGLLAAGLIGRRKRATSK